jgi:hypothetical protein
MGRWKEAAAELELALPGVSDRKSTHAALAECYRKMEIEGLAVLHDQLAVQVD